MHFACAYGLLEVAELFVTYEPDMNIKNYDGRTPLGEARMYTQDAIVDFIDRKYVFVDEDIIGTVTKPDGKVEQVNVTQEPPLQGDGWEARTDLKTGDVYYVNTTTGARQEAKPSALGGDWVMSFDGAKGGFHWENVVTGDIRDVDPEDAGKTRRVLRRRISIRVSGWWC